MLQESIVKILGKAVSFFTSRLAGKCRKTRMHHWRGLVMVYAPIMGVGLAGGLIRLWVISAVGFNPDYFDVDGYHAMAVAGLTGPVPTHFHPPGYPWFLYVIYSCFGIRIRVVYFLQAFLATVSILLVGCAAQRRYGTAGGFLAAALLAFSGYLCVFPSALGSENLCFLGVAVLTVILLPRPFSAGFLRLFIAAVLVGCLALVRTAMLGLGPGVALLAAMNRKRMSHLGRAVSVVVVLAAAFLPAMVFGLVRYEREGFFRLGSPWDVYNFWVGNNRHATGRIDPMPDIPKIGTGELPNEEARARFLGPRAWNYAFTHPFHEAVLVAKRLSYLFAPPKRDLIYIYGNGWAGELPSPVILTAYVWAASSVPLLVACIILALGLKGGEPAYWIALAMTGFGLAPYLISLGDARFLMPLHPFLAFAAGSVLRPAPLSGSWFCRVIAAFLMALFVANAFLDISATQPALEAIMKPGGSQLHPPYHFAR